MTILKEIFLRYRAEGHARFDLPESLCASDQALSLAAELQRLDGVYRVDVSPRHRKLSIRHMPMVLDFDSLIKSLADIVKTLSLAAPPQPMGPSRAPPPGGWLQKWNKIRPVRWARDKIQEVRETALALKILIRRGLDRSSDRPAPGDLMITFLNDALLFYLIKVHWDLMTRYWLRRPWEYRYQWLSAFYLLFLLIRSRQARLR